MAQVPVFDQEHYRQLNKSRSEFVSRFLSPWREQFKMRTAIDVGCGYGFFSTCLTDQGFEVTAIDGREDNVRQTQARNRSISAMQYDAEDPELARIGLFDLVLCFGLLYHLENPFRTIRTLRALTKHVLLLEGMCVPDEEPLMRLIDEGDTEDQGLNHVAFYPSESCLIMMLYRAGFPFVYEFAAQPPHPDYVNHADRHRYRTILAASLEELKSTGLRAAKLPGAQDDVWLTGLHRAKKKIRGGLGSLKRLALPPSQSSK